MRLGVEILLEGSLTFPNPLTPEKKPLAIPDVVSLNVMSIDLPSYVAA